MRTSLTEIMRIEDWLLKQGEVEERLITEGRLLTNPEMKERMKAQAVTYEVVRLYGREQLLREIKSVEHQLFHSPKYRSFQERIRSIFKS